jgi:hypothetical protein
MKAIFLVLFENYPLAGRACRYWRNTTRRYQCPATFSRKTGEIL